MDFFRLPILDVRILGAIAVALITLPHVTKPVASPKVTQPRLVRGALGVESLSFAMSPNGAWLATTNTAGGVMLRARDAGNDARRHLDFPGHATAAAFSPDGRYVAVAGLTSRHLCLGPDVREHWIPHRARGPNPASQAPDVLARRPVARDYNGL